MWKIIILQNGITQTVNQPPETAVFCYTENNNKKALTSIIQDKNDYKIIETNITFHVPCRNIEKEKKNQVRNTKDLNPGFYTKTRRKINKKTV